MIYGASNDRTLQIRQVSDGSETKRDLGVIVS